ncbi:MAG TPA: metal ABC transporter ATP-binding protein [Nitrososphaeraceae archaeon]|jgi:zinc transport system ATP-binding protein|nr:metal ABC transporter ATP-binding protein [Nitrososphaeraceae archaeon]
MQSIINVDDLSYYYDSFPSLDHVSFSVEKGDFLGIIGPNGAGKTTLFQCMLGILNNFSGEISLFGSNVKQNKQVLQRIGYVPQKKSVEQTFPATVGEIVSLGVIGRDIKKESIENAIEFVDLGSYRDKRIGELSEGQQQRVIIAKALVKQPELLILDEPTTGIDSVSQNKFYDLLTRLNKDRGITIVWSSHDMNAVEKLASKVACIDRKLFFHGESEDFFGNDERMRSYVEFAMQSHMNLHFGKAKKSPDNTENKSNGNVV